MALVKLYPWQIACWHPTITNAMIIMLKTLNSILVEVSFLFSLTFNILCVYHMDCVGLIWRELNKKKEKIEHEIMDHYSMLCVVCSHHWSISLWINLMEKHVSIHDHTLRPNNWLHFLLNSFGKIHSSFHRIELNISIFRYAFIHTHSRFFYRIWLLIRDYMGFFFIEYVSNWY